MGIEADLRALPKTADCTRADVQLFSESNCRFVVEVEPDKFDAFAKLMLNLPFGQIGRVVEEPRLIIRAAEGGEVINAELKVLKEAWQKTFDW
jgi:phosphoribosylformylglycinamidine synthase